MQRSTILLVSLLSLPSTVLAQEDPDWKHVVRLQKRVQDTIEQAEPSIACILVSRSDLYRRHALAIRKDDTLPGTLGGFDPRIIDRVPGLTQAERTTLRKRLDLSDLKNVPEAFGSGVVIDSKGLLLTNFHVVRAATKVFVRLPGSKGSYADILAADARSDLAVLRLRSPVGRLQPIRFGDATGIKRGQFVISLANPFAVGFRDGKPSASFGIVSNVRRRAPGDLNEAKRTKSLHHYGTLVQLDARLNLGCSGGAVLNLKGEMLALTTSLAAIHGGETPGGYAVPMDAGMRRIVEVLRRGEEIDYGFLGVGFSEEPQNNDGGVELEFVTPGSPAAFAGLRARDVVMAVGDTPIKHGDDLFLSLGTQLAGAKVQLTIRKNIGLRPKTFQKIVTLAKFHFPGKSIASSVGKRPYFRGMRVDYTSVLVQKPLGLTTIPQGVLVSAVKEGSRASKAKLKAGELITQVNGEPVRSPSDFYQKVAGLDGPIQLTIAGYDPRQPTAKITLDE